MSIAFAFLLGYTIGASAMLLGVLLGQRLKGGMG